MMMEVVGQHEAHLLSKQIPTATDNSTPLNSHGFAQERSSQDLTEFGRIVPLFQVLIIEGGFTSLGEGEGLSTIEPHNG